MVIQLLRTKEFRTHYVELLEKAWTQFLETEHSVNLVEHNLRIKVSDTRVSLEHAGFIFKEGLQERLTEILLNHIWIIGVNESDQFLYTSDNPVVRQSYQNKPGYAGLASPGIQISLPLTPEYILLLCEKNTFKEVAHLDCHSLSLDSEGVRYYNHLQVFQSYRQIYCSKSDFLLAAEICCEYPQVCNPDRGRTQVYSDAILD